MLEDVNFLTNDYWTDDINLLSRFCFNYELINSRKQRVCR